MDNMRMLVGERIRTLRKERGWSQEELGEKADLHHTYVGAVEGARRTLQLTRWTRSRLPSTSRSSICLPLPKGEWTLTG